MSSLAGGRTAIDNALASISNLTNKLNGGGSTIATGISTIAPAIGVLASENHQISELLTQLSDLGAAGTKIAQQSGQNAVADTKDLLPVLQQLESVTSQLAPDLRTLAGFEAETPKIAPGDYLQVSAVVNVLLPAGSFVATPGRHVDVRRQSDLANVPIPAVRRGTSRLRPASGGPLMTGRP